MPRPETDEFDLILRQHGNAVWRLIVRILGDDGHDAVDCFQQAMVELVARHRRMGDVRESIALLKRISTARAIDALRRRIRQRGRSPQVDAARIISHPASQPEAVAEAVEFLDSLRSALAGLPEAQAAAFVLTQIEGVPNDEAALALGVTSNHLGVLLHRARAALQKSLESYRPG